MSLLDAPQKLRLQAEVTLPFYLRLPEGTRFRYTLSEANITLKHDITIVQPDVERPDIKSRALSQITEERRKKIQNGMWDQTKSIKWQRNVTIHRWTQHYPEY